MKSLANAFLLLTLLIPYRTESPDFRFILQTQGGITAYTTLPVSISLPLARQLFSSIETETQSFIYGEYILAGRVDAVKLAVGADGWIVAFHPRDYTTARWLDCAGQSRPETAVLQIADALGYPDPDIGFYDGRFPEATAVAVHWLYTQHGTAQTSTITLPIANLYLDRGYNFCTALTNSKFFLNDQIIEQAGGVTQVIRHWEPLQPDQLRAGQTNTMRIEALSLFGSGLLGGVSMVYQGNDAVTTTGGEVRVLSLAFPTMLGQPLNIEWIFLPLIVEN